MPHPSHADRPFETPRPSGQRIASELGVEQLARRDLDELSGLGVNLDRSTPLWYYVLKEAEVQEQGQRLGEVGSRIVCTTLIGQAQADPDSYLNREGGAWSTAEGVKLPGGGEVNSIKTFLEFAGVQI